MLKKNGYDKNYAEELIRIYEPILAELTTVEESLEDILTDKTKELSELCGYVTSYKGKMLRPALLLLSGALCNDITNQHIQFAIVLELIHLTTLIHDDVIDESDMRRNRRVLNRLWGNQASVLFGDFLLSKAFSLCNGIGNLSAAYEISKTTEIVCRGEIIQTLKSGNWQITEDEYMKIIEWKTASLYQLCCYLGASLAGADNAEIISLKNYGRYLGIAYQITDDLLDIIGDDSEIGKDIGRDLSQGKATLAIIHFLKTSNRPECDMLIRLIENVKGNVSEIRSLLESRKSILYTRNKIDELIALANNQLVNFSDCEAKRSLMQISDFVARRI